ncbi:hypothetical protein DES36_12726 [Alkalibaculum bacchi]|uniref:Uncharacterized protein n=1 Tax=Alkalibaculum bacchi TaxID=645887 RepID=A0A366HWK2_9FIRM|nr:hypothetical protein DES36_12726 [Alkalibaculum bacchi]
MVILKMGLELETDAIINSIISGFGGFMIG